MRTMRTHYADHCYAHVDIYGIPLQCVDPLGCIEVERDTALHKQRDVIRHYTSNETWYSITQVTRRDTAFHK